MKKTEEIQLINIPSGDPNIVIEIIKRVNKTYKSHFEFMESKDRGGVEFAIVKRGASSLDEVFLLGYYYGAKVKELRDQNKIDW